MKHFDANKVQSESVTEAPAAPSVLRARGTQGYEWVVCQDGTALPEVAAL